MIENIISNYLKENKRLILPELGAFLKKDDGSVVFVPFLNKDDGVLSYLVKHAYGATQIEANNIITQYISAIRASITGNGYYLIKNLGALKADVNGIIILDPSIIEGLSQAQVAIPKPTVAPSVNPIIPTPEPAPKTVDILTTIETPKFVKIQKPAEASKPTEMQSPTRVDAPKVASNPELVEPAQPKPIWERDSYRPVTNISSTAAANTTTNRPAPQQINSGSKKTDKILIIAVIAAAIAIAAMIYGYFADDMPVFNLSDGEVQTEQVQVEEVATEQPVTK